MLVFLLTRLEIELSATWGYIRNSDPFYFALAVLVHYTTFIFRGARWRLLLKNSLKSPEAAGTPSRNGLQGNGNGAAATAVEQNGHMPQERLEPVQAGVPSAWYCGSLILLSWFANSITWFRLGDAYRAYAYSEDTKGSFSRTAGTILAERIFDVVLVFLLMLASALALYVSRGQAPSWLFIGIALILVVGVAAVLLGMTLLRHRLTRLLPGRLREAYHRFHHGTIASFRQLPLVMSLGLLGWMSEVGRLFFVVKALGLSLDFSLIVFVTLANALLTLVPVTPGGLGIVEPGITGLLRVLTTLSRGVALSVTLLDRSISYVSIVVVGALLFMVREVRKQRRAARQGVMAVSR